MCHDNVGFKTRACQSPNGRVLSLNRQENIGPHPAPQNSSEANPYAIKINSFSGLVTWKRNWLLNSLSCDIQMTENLLAMITGVKKLYPQALPLLQILCIVVVVRVIVF